MLGLEFKLTYSRLILIYLCCLAAFIPFLWIICPETKSKSLEEIGAIFGDRTVHVVLDDQNMTEEKGQDDKIRSISNVRSEVEHIEG